MLTSLEIKNFRTFAHLRIERLGQANLIVGKNNVGKTTLLEALQVYASRRPSQAIMNILDNRDQVVANSTGRLRIELESLFHTSGPVGLPATIGPVRHSSQDKPDLVIERLKVANGQTVGEPVPFVSIRSGDHDVSLYTDGSNISIGTEKEAEPLPFDPSAPFLRLSTGRLAIAEMALRWDFIALTPGEPEVLKALKIIARIDKVAFVVDPRSKTGDRLAKVLLGGISRAVPLASLGEGVGRMFQLALAIQYSALAGKAARDFNLPRNVFLPVLVDEIETGIHHSSHADMWRFVLKAAHELGVQVFATTHSWDCVKGFAEAVQDVPECDALAIRLERSEDRTRAVSFTAEELKIVAREEIEVR